MEYNAVKKFNALSEEQKIERIYHRAMMSLQSSIDMIYRHTGDMQDSLKEYKAMVIAEIEYLCTKTGDDPRCLYPHEEAK